MNRVPANPRFDCELPPKVRLELTQPRRPMMIRQSAKMNWRILGFTVLGTFTATALLVSLAQHSGQDTPKPVRLIAPLSPVQNAPALNVEVRRAVPVLYKEWKTNGIWQICYSTCTPIRGEIIVDPAPRAQLVKNP